MAMGRDSNLYCEGWQWGQEEGQQVPRGMVEQGIRLLGWGLDVGGYLREQCRY